MSYRVMVPVMVNMIMDSLVILSAAKNPYGAQ